MAYHGYIWTIGNYLQYIQKEKLEPIRVLEIGVYKGITTFSLINNLNCLGIKFIYDGIDIKIRNEVKITCQYMLKHKGSEINLIEDNSLNYLKNIKETYDVILIDGDHNYETVKSECELVKDLMHDNTLLIFDDYDGKWSNKDLYYSERDEYIDNEIATKRTNKFNKHGVKPAVDEFLENNRDTLFSFKIKPFEHSDPLCVIGRNNKIINPV